MKYDDDCPFCKLLRSGFPLKICDLSVSIVVLHPDQLYYGRCMVVLKWHETELYRLSRSDRIAFYEDMIMVAKAISNALKPDKLNYEVLGNVVPHLHWHLIPRYHSDPAWGKPVWSVRCRPKHLSKEEYDELIELIGDYLRNA